MLDSVCVLLALGAVAAASEPSAPEADERVVRASEALRTKEEAWEDSGFRLALGFGYENLVGGPKTPSMSALATTIHLGWRLTEHWGVLAELRYTIPVTDFVGVRWSATLEPVLYVIDGLAVSTAVGYAGLLGDRNPRPPYPYDDVGRQLLEPGSAVDLPAFVRCDGDGLTTSFKVLYLFTVGESFATGPQVRIGGQWTRCTDDRFGESTPFDSAADADLAPHQWWLHLTLAAHWVMAWR